MKKLSLKVLTLLTLVLWGSQAHAAASTIVGEGEAGAIQETVFKSQVLKAIDLVYGHDEDARSEISQERRAFQGADRSVAVIDCKSGKSYIVWGGYRPEPMALEETETFPEEIKNRIINPTWSGEERCYLNVSSYEEKVKCPDIRHRLAPAVFERVMIAYPFIDFTSGVPSISDEERTSFALGVEIPASSGVLGSIPKEGFVANGSSLFRIWNKDNGEIALINGLVEEPYHHNQLNKIIGLVKKDSPTSQVHIDIFSHLFGVNEIALGQVLTDFGYFVHITASPHIIGSPVCYYQSDEAKLALVDAELFEYAKMVKLFSEEGRHYSDLPSRPDIERNIIQTVFIDMDGNVKRYLNRGNPHLSMDYTPDLPKDDGRKWYDFSPTKFDNPEEGEESAASAAASSASVDA